MGKFKKDLTTFYRAFKDVHFDNHFDKVSPQCVFTPKEGDFGLNREKRRKGVYFEKSEEMKKKFLINSFLVQVGITNLT